jgi:2-dehydro-3-deoxyphosphooctonate aldolase (KDO 8-P synthase)
MEHVIKKLSDAGNNNIMLTERGTMFGYQNLIVDYRNILIMKEFGYPVIMDVTHATQRPGAAGGKSGGNPKFAPSLAYCAAVCGADGFFFEVHPEPKSAKSDASTMIDFDTFDTTLKNLVDIFRLKRGF